MNKLSLASPPLAAQDDKKKPLCWIDNPSVHKLLDVISSILAEEYIQIARQNKDVFQS